MPLRGQPEKYNNSDGMMIATVTGNAMIALNTLNDKDWLYYAMPKSSISKISVEPPGML